MPTIATDGKGNYVTLDSSGNWVPTTAPSADQPQGGNRFQEAPPEQPKQPDKWVATTQPTNETTGGSEDTGLPVPRSLPPGGLVDTSLTPRPGVATFAPLSRETPDSGTRFAVPNAIRALLYEGPQVQGGQVTVPAVTTNPETGAQRLTPEAAAAGSLLQPSPLRFSGANTLMRTPGGATFTGPLPVTPDELTAAILRADRTPPNGLGPQPAVSPTPEAPPAPAAPAASGVWVPMEAGRAYPEGWQTRINRDAGGRAEVLDPTRGPQPQPTSSSAPPGSTPPPAAAQPASTGAPQVAAPAPAAAPADPPIMSQADIQARGRGYYNAADQAASQGAMLPDTNAAAVRKLFSDFIPSDTEAARISAGDPAMQAAKNVNSTGPMSYDTAMRIDRDLTARMRGASGTDAHELSQLQQGLRDQMDQVPDLDNLRPGRDAWRQSIKQGQMEDINAGAELKNDPAQADAYVRQRAAALLKNDNAMRYWTPEEQAQLTQVAKSGDIGMLGRLTTALIRPVTRVALGAVGHSVAGPLGAIVGSEVGGDVGATAASRVRSYLSQTTLDPVMQQITRGVPPPYTPPNTLGPQP